VGFVRSTEAHADIVRIRTDEARAMPGVVAVLTADDLGLDVPPQPSTHALGNRPTPYYALARDRVRHVGEAIVAVVAETAAQLADAMGLVEIDYRSRPTVVDTLHAATDGSPTLFDGWPDNVAGSFETAMGDVDAAVAGADTVVRARIRIQRQTGASMEGRGALAEWDRYRRELVLWTSTQSPHIVRDFIAEVTGVPTPRVKVRVPQVGGGFGAKFHFYAEESAVALIAIRLNRPVMWNEGRSESFIATVHAREAVVDAVIAARKTHHKARRVLIVQSHKTNIGANARKAEVATIINNKSEFRRQPMQRCVTGEALLQRAHIRPYVKGCIGREPRQWRRQHIADGFGLGVLVNQAMSLQGFDKRGEARLLHAAQLQIGAGAEIQQAIAICFCAIGDSPCGGG
jgi:CO/xanthine dehydrogenase Mo-binding subunit